MVELVHARRVVGKLARSSALEHQHFELGTPPSFRLRAIVLALRAAASALLAGPPRLLVLSSHLDFEAFRIRYVEAAFGRADLQAASLQFRFDGGLHGLVGVPAGD